jgi:hypothetical protein
MLKKMEIDDKSSPERTGVMFVMLAGATHAGHTYRAHKDILAHFSTYFEADVQWPFLMGLLRQRM